jgi:hypothetical protein
MGQFSGKYHLAFCIVHHSDPGGTTARIELDTQRLNLWRLNFPFEHNRKWVAFEHCRLSRSEQEPRFPWMDRTLRLLIGIDNKNV